jgi:hypothetical protein
VRQRIHVPIVLFLCLIATGSQWDLVQTFAWGRMMVMNSHSMPLSKAVAQTFSGEMCPICHLVANAEKQEKSRSEIPEAKLAGKVLLYFQKAPAVVVTAPDGVAWFPGNPLVATEGRVAPPVPPPRGVSCLSASVA